MIDEILNNGCEHLRNLYICDIYLFITLNLHF